MKLRFVVALFLPVILFTTCGKQEKSQQDVIPEPIMARVNNVDHYSVEFKILSDYTAYGGLILFISDLYKTVDEFIGELEKGNDRSEYMRPVSFTYDRMIENKGFVTANHLQAGIQYYCFFISPYDSQHSDVIPVKTLGFNYTAEAVDMGLSVKWSSTDLGAQGDDPTELLFSWGELGPKDLFEDEYYKWYRYWRFENDESSIFEEEKLSGKMNVSFGLENDAARYNLGGTWRVPTFEEWQELFSNSHIKKDWYTTTFISKINGNQLVLHDGHDEFHRRTWWSSTYSNYYDTYYSTDPCMAVYGYGFLSYLGSGGNGYALSNDFNASKGGRIRPVCD